MYFHIRNPNVEAKKEIKHNFLLLTSKQSRDAKMQDLKQKLDCEKIKEERAQKRKVR